MKKKIAVLAIVLSLLSISIMGTFAYFTDTAVAHNIITSGDLDIEIVETQLKDGEEVAYPEEPILVMPGETVSKIVRIHNHAGDAYIRARFETEISKDNVTLEEKEGMIQIATGVKWEKRGDWYYYVDAVNGENSTEALFETVVFNGPLTTNEYQDSVLNVNVYAQAVQVANNGDSVFEAQGWPQEILGE